MHLAMITE